MIRREVTHAKKSPLNYKGGQSMKRKCMIVGIILAFVGTCIIPSTAQSMEKTESKTRGNWLYVGSFGPGNFSTIQDAINSSQDGDTIYVYDDASPYLENVIIDKAISLLGEDRETTIIDSGNVTILILADDVYVSGFTITNSQWVYGIYRAGIYILSNDTVIFDNIITHVWEGIDCGWFNRSVDHIDNRA